MAGLHKELFSSVCFIRVYDGGDGIQTRIQTIVIAIARTRRGLFIHVMEGQEACEKVYMPLTPTGGKAVEVPGYRPEGWGSNEAERR